MSKFTARVLRKDASDTADHKHKMPKGERAEEFTGPMLMKPNGHHSHLYTVEGGDTAETSVADTGVPHEHETLDGDTGPAIVIPPKEMENDKEYKAGDQDGIVGGVNKNSREGRVDSLASASAMLKRSYASGQVKNPEAKKRYEELLKTEKDPEKIAMLKKAIAAHSDEGIAPTMKEFAKGELKSSSGEKVTDPKQAAAIGYSEQRGDSRKWGNKVFTK